MILLKRHFPPDRPVHTETMRTRVNSKKLHIFSHQSHVVVQIRQIAYFYFTIKFRLNFNSIEVVNL